MVESLLVAAASNLTWCPKSDQEPTATARATTATAKLMMTKQRRKNSRKGKSQTQKEFHRMLKRMKLKILSRAILIPLKKQISELQTFLKNHAKD